MVFDIVYSRFLVQHLDEPTGALQQMWRRVKPGGALIVQDHYHPSLDSDPPSDAVAELKRTFANVWEKAGRDIRTGIKLPGYFIRAGIGRPDGTDVAGDLLPMSESSPMGAAVYRSLLPLALKFGVTTEERSQGFLEEIGKRQDDASYLLWPLVISVWKRMPQV
jgi:SAM-dependent methyltransferase